MPYRSELTDRQAHRHLAGYVRNYLPSPGVKFGPWHGLELQYDHDGKLYHIHPQGARREIMAVEEVYGLSDEELVKRILEVIGQ